VGKWPMVVSRQDHAGTRCSRPYQLVAANLTNAEIADRLRLGESTTVETPCRGKTLDAPGKGARRKHPSTPLRRSQPATGPPGRVKTHEI
jgi:hypothetical protein